MTPEQITELNERVDAEHACGHERTELRVLTKSNGSTEVRRQCQRCGGMVEAVKKRMLAVGVLERLPEWDEALRRRWQDTVDGARQVAFRQAQDADRVTWFKEHDAYLRTPRWRNLRQQVLERDDWTCQECDAPAEHIHHLTYAHWGDERLYELVALCFNCHDDAHEGALSQGERRAEQG